MKALSQETREEVRGRFSPLRALILSLTILALLLGTGGMALAVTDPFYSSGTWVAPLGVTSVTVECWGGGGAGGGLNGTSNGGGGGGGGAYARKVVTVTPETSYAVVVGAGGVGVAAATGGSGGMSYFIDNATVRAGGGLGGVYGVPGTAGGAGGLGGTGVGDVTFTGGTGEPGRTQAAGIGGHGGSSAGTAADGYSAPSYTTNVYPVASTPAGAGHGGDGGLAGANGSAPASGNGGGGGGSGDGTNRVGGNGAPGKVLITYTLPPVHAYGAISSAAGPLVPNGTPQDVATVPVTVTNGGTVTGFTVLLGGTITAGDVTSVTVVGGGTWTAGGSFGSGSQVNCTGTATEPTSPLTIRVTLATSAGGKTVSARLMSETPGIGVSGLPTVAGSAVSISVPPSHTYGNISPAVGPLGANGTSQEAATVPVMIYGGGYSVTGYTVALSGTVTAGDVTAVSVVGGGTWTSANGSYGNGSAVSCTGTGTIPVDPLSIRVTLAPSAAGKTVGVLLQSENPGTNVVGMPTTAGIVNIAPATTPETLSVPANTPVAITATPGQANVQMQVLRLASNHTDDGQVVVTSVTVDDLLISAAGTISTLKIVFDNDSNYGNGYLGTPVSVGSWTGQTQVVDVTSIPVAYRTVTSAVPKYLWIIYDINAATPDGTKVQSSVTAVGVAGPDSGASGTWNSTAIPIATVQVNKLTSCASCHKYPPQDATAGSRNTPAGAVVGSHAKHPVACSTCHVGSHVSSADPSQFKHQDRRISFQSNIRNGSYSRAVATGYVDRSTNPTLGTCSNVSCHGTGVTPFWGQTGAITCTNCHGLPPATNAHTKHYTAKNASSGEIGWTTGSTAKCTACHPDNTTTHTPIGDGVVVLQDAMNAVGTSPAISCSSSPTGCHLSKVTPAWNTTGIVCTKCHSTSGATSGDPVSGLHRVTFITRHDHTLLNGQCVNCHDPVNASSAHWNGTVNTPANATYAFVAGITYTSAGCQAGNVGCHTDGGDWRRNWNTVVNRRALATDNPGDPVCQNCHGDYTGWRWNEANPGTTDHTDTYLGNVGDYLGLPGGQHPDCKLCHGWGPGTSYNKVWLGSSNPAYIGHGDGHITMNSESGYIDTGTNQGGCSAACHGAQLTLDTDSGWTANYGTFGAGDCNGCHGYPPLETVSADYPDSRVQNYAGGGSGHAIAKHIPKNTTKDQGWDPCLPCHYNNAVNHGMTGDVTNRAQIQVEINPGLQYNGGTPEYLKGAADGSDGMGMGQCWNVDCHFWESPKWDCTP